MENFQLISLDTYLNTIEDYRNSLIKLNSSVQFFIEPLKCIDFIKTIKKEKIIFIISQSLANQVLENIHSYTQLSAIFIFCSNQDFYKDLLIKYKKIIGIFNNQNDLLEAIEKIIKKIEKQFINIIIFDPNNSILTKNLSKQYVTFLWPQLFIKVLRNLPINTNEINQFSKICKDYYQNNSIEMKNIEDFSLNYQSNQSIEWYTKELFLYKIINKALQFDNIDLLCSYSFFIKDLCHELDIEKQNLIKNDLLTFYRGITILDTQIKYYNDMKEKFVLIKGFFFATRSKNLALTFTGQTDENISLSINEVSVLFQINVNPNDNILFADITHRNSLTNEKEILFGPNTVFYVDSVDFDQIKRCLNIIITAKDVFNKYIYKYIHLEHEEIKNCEPFTYFGRLLFDKLNQIECAEKYFNILLKKLPTNHDTIPEIYCQLGDLNLFKKNVNNALDYYTKAMKHYRQYPDDYTNIIDCLLKIGNAYLSEEYNNINTFHPEFQFDNTTGVAALTYRSRLENILKTLDLAKEAMEILDKTSDEDLSRRGKVHQLMGRMYLVRGKIFHEEGKIYLSKIEIKKADQHLQIAFTIFNDITPLENAYLVSIVGDISNFYIANGKYLIARRLLREQLNMAEKYLPFDHPKQTEYLKNFISIYKSHDLKDKAIKIAWEKLERYEKNFGQIHPIIAQTLMSIGYYDRACYILFQIDPIDEYNIIQCLNELTQRKYLNKKQIELFQNWFDYLRQNYPSTDKRIADVLCHFANIYNDMGKFDIAYTYLHKSLPIYRYHQDHFNLRIVEDFMRHIEQGTGRLHSVNIVCDDHWKNGLEFLGKFDDIQTLSVPSVRQQIQPNNSQIRSLSLKKIRKIV